MSSEESDEIVLISSNEKREKTKRELESSSDIEIEVLGKELVKPPRRRKSAVPQTTNQKRTKIKQQKIKKEKKVACTEEEPKTFSSTVNEISEEIPVINNTKPIIIKPEDVKKRKIIRNDGGKETVFYLNDEDSLEVLYDNLSSDAKVMYKGMFVSKFLTFEDLNYTEEENVFEVIGNKKKFMNIKINLDFNKSISVEVEEDFKISQIFELFDAAPNKENKLVINGYILKDDSLVCDFLEEEDVLDYV